MSVLTPREQEVAGAARGGGTLRDIAAQLFVSPRTIETHLSSIYRKLGVTSRLELVALLSDDASPAAVQAPPPAPTGARLPFPRGLLAADGFVGRSEELALLSAAMLTAQKGRCTAVAIGGEPGVGKSALVAEAARRGWNGGSTVLVGHCQPELRTPFQPVVDAIKPFLAELTPDQARGVSPSLGTLATVVPELSDHLPAALPMTDAATGQRVLLDSFLATLAATAPSDGPPAVLVIEDLHWADHATLGLLRRLLGWTDACRVLVVMTFRNTELAVPHPLGSFLADLWRVPNASRIDLDGISAEEADELARSIGLPATAADDAHDLWRRTDGNPFFLTQLLRAQGEGTPGVRLPASVSEVISSRVRVLGPQATTTLQIAATIGAEFDFRLLLTVEQDASAVTAATGPIGASLDRAIDAGLVRVVDDSGSTYRFVHEVVRETLLSTAGPTRRAELHLAVGHALQHTSSDDVTVLAITSHLAAALPLGDIAEAAGYALQAAASTLERLAPEDALALIHRGLDQLGPDGNDALRLELLLTQIDALGMQMSRPEHRQATLDAVTIARRMNDPAALARAATRYYVVPATGSVDQEMLTVTEEAILALGPEPGSLRSELLGNIAYQLTIAGRGEDARRWGEQAVAEGRTADEKALGDGLYALAAASMGQPDLGRQRAITDELVGRGPSWPERGPVRDGRRFRGLAALSGGDRPTFEADLTAIDDLGLQTGSVFLRCLAHSWRTLLALLDGDLADAELVAGDVLAMANDDPNFQLGWLVQLVTVRAEQDRLGELVPLVAQTSAEHPDLPALQALDAWVRATTGDLVGAHQCVEPMSAAAFTALPYDWLRPALLGWLGESVAELGDPSSALALAAELEPYRGQVLVAGAGSMVVATADSVAGRLLACDLDSWPVASERLSAGTALADRIGAVLCASHSRLHHAELLVRRDEGSDRQDATSLLAEVATIASRPGLVKLARRTAELRNRLASRLE